ncbi:D-alanyl-D-alanine carboxypeptidase family protein [Pacificibacter marinus]|uniref:serine-type D-Ala-D-Ala carboxypeptidase n=1 Tax=Pacificibacter marinus TaxID=658057 RepID=A0A1Y5SYV4_9RHOB|nr:D-alanyl-D-alanine carboxypeptidase family protein [Pacificibacter marinus]SEK85450.1 D-alanyl-D-alanine carboxypeptidase (penicillin-binding protein 5/6) [Pacificibacter marinus]SLN49713.1 D-alanyl-D-alanine carboxypeptidase DacC precursor [Pacificibacter marinus]
MPRVLSRIACLLTTLSLSIALALPAAAFETRARAAWVYDLTTDTLLLSKEADVPLPPASMSKLMTLNMLFEALRDGRVTLDTQFSVSSRAKSMGGSTMFLDETDRPTVEELIQGIIVLSGNDACVTVAEGLAGTEDNFARLMNERAKTLGMDNSTFANASGWPNPNQRMSMEDLGLLAKRLINDFPEYYGYFGQLEFPYDNRAPQNRHNRNPLLKLGIGADGLKTGHTQEAGYGLVGSAMQGNRRLVFVITGMASEAERAQEAERIVSWGFRQFAQKTVATQGQEFARADVWMGSETSVGLIAPEDMSLLLPAPMLENVTGTVEYSTPLEAPIMQGDKVAELVIDRGDMQPARLPLVADRSIERGGIGPRLRTAFSVLRTKLTTAKDAPAQ